MKITVHTEVTCEHAGGLDHYPSKLAWLYETIAGGNPKFYGDSVQRALERAFVDCRRGTDPYVQYRDGSYPSMLGVRQEIEAQVRVQVGAEIRAMMSDPSGTYTADVDRAARIAEWGPNGTPPLPTVPPFIS